MVVGQRGNWYYKIHRHVIKSTIGHKLIMYFMARRTNASHKYFPLLNSFLILPLIKTSFIGDYTWKYGICFKWLAFFHEYFLVWLPIGWKINVLEGTWQNFSGLFALEKYVLLIILRLFSIFPLIRAPLLSSRKIVHFFKIEVQVEAMGTSYDKEQKFIYEFCQILPTKGLKLRFVFRKLWECQASTGA